MATSCTVRSRAAASLALVALIWLIALPSARGDDGPRTVLMLCSPAQSGESETIAQALRAQLSDLDVRLEIREVDGLGAGGLAAQISAAGAQMDGSTIAAFWYDFSEQGSVYLFLAGGGGDRVLVRKLEESQASGRAEGLALIVRASVAAIMHGGRIGISVDEAVRSQESAASAPLGPREAPLPPIAAGPAPRVTREGEGEAKAENRASRLFLHLSYAYHARSAAHPMVNGLRVGLDLALIPRLYLTAGYTVVERLEATGDSVTMRLVSHPVDVGLAARFALGPVALGGGLALVVDYEEQEISRLKDGMRRNPDGEDVVIGARLLFEAAVAVAPRLEILLALGAQLQMNPKRYTARDGGEREVLVGTWPVLPLGFFGLRVGLF